MPHPYYGRPATRLVRVYHRYSVCDSCGSDDLTFQLGRARKPHGGKLHWRCEACGHRNRIRLSPRPL